MSPGASGGNCLDVAPPREQAHAAARSRSGSGTMRVRAILLAAALVLAPLGARAADLTVWWEKGFYPEEQPAVREIITAFERKTGKQVDLTFHPPFDLPALLAAV